MTQREQSLVTLEYLVTINGVTSAGFANAIECLAFYDRAVHNWTDRAVLYPKTKWTIKIWCLDTDTNEFRVIVRENLRDLAYSG